MRNRANGIAPMTALMTIQDTHVVLNKAKLLAAFTGVRKATVFARCHQFSVLPFQHPSGPGEASRIVHRPKRMRRGHGLIAYQRDGPAS